jgi:DNA gyrase subunit A
MAELTAILDSPARLRQVVSDELAAVADRFGTPRRTVLLEGTGAARTAAVPLEVADDPCLVLLSSTGLIARTAATDRGGAAAAAGSSPVPGPRAAHDVIVSSVPSTARGITGVITSLGRLIRVGVMEIPALPPSAHSPSLAGGAPITEFVSLTRGETVVGLASADGQAPGLALGTAAGVVKRVSPDYPANAADFEVIALKDGDLVVRAVELGSEADDLVVITSDAQLLRFGAGAVRPQGRAAGGMAGVRLAPGASVIWFGSVRQAAQNVVVTVAGAAGALPGTAAATIKVTPYREYPAKGRATGGVRCHRFLKGEDTLVLAWAGPGPARGATDAGVAVDLPAADGRRDGSGERVRQPLSALGGPAELNGPAEPDAPAEPGGQAELPVADPG